MKGMPSCDALCAVQVARSCRLCKMWQASDFRRTWLSGTLDTVTLLCWHYTLSVSLSRMLWHRMCTLCGFERSKGTKRHWNPQLRMYVCTGPRCCAPGQDLASCRQGQVHDVSFAGLRVTDTHSHCNYATGIYGIAPYARTLQGTASTEQWSLASGSACAVMQSIQLRLSFPLPFGISCRRFSGRQARLRRSQRLERGHDACCGACRWQLRAIAASDFAEMMRRAVAFTRFATSFTCNPKPATIHMWFNALGGGSIMPSVALCIHRTVLQGCSSLHSARFIHGFG